MSHQGRATEARGDQDNHRVTVSLGRRVSLAWGVGGNFLSVSHTHVCTPTQVLSLHLFFLDEAMVWKQPGISQRRNI